MLERDGTIIEDIVAMASASCCMSTCADGTMMPHGGLAARVGRMVWGARGVRPAEDYRVGAAAVCQDVGCQFTLVQKALVGH